MPKSLPILTHPHPLLRKVAKDIPDPQDPQIKGLILDMRETLEKNEGVGLAAPQVGKSIRVFVAEVDNKFYAFINPQIKKRSHQKVIMEEGCLSIPGVFGEVERPAKVTITAFNEDGKKVKIKAGGLLARVIQHEMDHLEGILFVDRIKQLSS